MNLGPLQYPTPQCKYSDLTRSELVDLSLWDSPDVVVGRVGSLLHEEEGDPLEELVPGHRRHGQVEEQPVQHRQWDEVHRTEKWKLLFLRHCHEINKHRTVH